MYDYHGLAPEKWNPYELEECCLETLPRKVSAEISFFQATSPVLAAFFNFLAENKILRQARRLARQVQKIGPQIVKNSQDPRYWGMAKSFVMAAMEADVDVTDEKQMQLFMHMQNLQAIQQTQSAQEELAPLAISDPSVPYKRSHHKIGRNEPCPCGSGKKYKKCCGR